MTKQKRWFIKKFFHCLCVWDIHGYIINICKTYCGCQLWIERVVCEPQEETGEDKRENMQDIQNKRLFFRLQL